MRLSVAAAVISLSIVAVSAAADVEAAIKRYTNIPPQSLGQALRGLAKERDFQIVYASQEVSARRTEGAVGEFTAAEALEKLLSGTGLGYRYLDDKTVTIFPLATDVAGGREDGAASRTPSAPRAGQAPNAERRGADAREVQKPSFWDRFRVAQVDQGATRRSDAVASSGGEVSESNSRGKLEEIVVSAQKRDERLLDVPVPVTAVSAEDLIDNNLVRTQDFYNRVPGLDFIPGDRGQLNLSIRGLTTGFYTVSTVGYVVDDVPFGASSIWMSAPEIDPNELSSVEVLRGPQGTLYGANSLGGLIKYVTIDPSLAGFSGRVQGGLTSLRNGEGLGYNVRGAVNVPLSETWAMRLGGFSRLDPGYIDNPVRGEEGINEARAYGARLSAMWRPSEDLSLKLGAMVQNWNADGGPYSFDAPGFTDLQQDLYPGAGEAQNKSRVFNATLKAKLGAVELTSVSAYSYQNWGGTLDDHILVPFAEDTFPGAGINFVDYHSGDKYSQELRLTGAAGARIDWLLGAFYTNEKYRNTFDMPAIDPDDGTNIGYWTQASDDGTSVYKEYAVFADVTFHLTDRFNVQVGGRTSRIDQDAKQSAYFSYFAQEFFGVDPFIQEFPAVRDEPTTYLVAPQFKVSDDLMLYARLASGFRPGGANTFVAALNGAPSTYEPDETENYEIGAKGELLDGALTFDASVYRIDWDNIQLTLIPPNGIGTYNGNGGGAKSEGVELAVEARPLSGLRIGGWLALSSAELTEDLPLGQYYGVSGDRLPFSARVTGNLSMDFDFPLSGTMLGSVGGTLVYVGDRKESFTGPPPAERLSMPSYTQLDLRAGVSFGSWDANLIVTNLADERGILRPAQVGTRGIPAVTYIQPRAISLLIAKTF